MPVVERGSFSLRFVSHPPFRLSLSVPHRMASHTASIVPPQVANTLGVFAFTAASDKKFDSHRNKHYLKLVYGFLSTAFYFGIHSALLSAGVDTKYYAIDLLLVFCSLATLVALFSSRHTLCGARRKRSSNSPKDTPRTKKMAKSKNVRGFDSAAKICQVVAIYGYVCFVLTPRSTSANVNPHD